MKCTAEDYCTAPAEYKMKNGDVETVECELHLKDSLLDLVTNNERVEFSFTPAIGGELAIIELV